MVITGSVSGSKDPGGSAGVALGVEGVADGVALPWLGGELDCEFDAAGGVPV